MRQVILHDGRTRATVLPDSGGRLHQLEVTAGAGAPLSLLLAPPDPATHRTYPMSYGCFPMAPWPNRIAGARFTWQGETHQLDASFEGHAIHGTVYVRPWAVLQESADEVQMTCDLGDGWPWPGRAVQRIAVSDDGIDLRLEVHAGAAASFPAGAGWHPWFVRMIGGHEASVLVDAGDTYDLRDMIPSGGLLPVAGDTDLRAGPPLGDRRLDTCYRGVRGPMRIRWGDIELAMTQSANATHAVVYTPPHAVCIEPQTCAIDAFNLHARGIEGTGVAVVTRDAPLVAETSWRWRVH